MNLGRRIGLFGAWTSGEWNFHWGCALISEIKENDDEHSMLGCCCWLQLGLPNWVNYLVDLTGWLVCAVLQRNLKMVQ
jgi:hypothetical protein